jgi:hypothetical protein
MNPTVAGLIWIGLGLAVLTFGALFVLEGVLYLLRQDPITVYVRNWSWHYVFPAAFVAVGLVAGASAALTHFILDGQR